MRYKVFCSIIMLMLNMGCKSPAKPVVNKAWSELTIISEYNTQILINNDDDTSTVTIYHRGTFFSPLPKNAAIKVDTLKALFTKTEKDTLFSLSEDLITHPVVTNKLCTEYVGGLELIIEYGQGFKQSGRYSSVCNWNKLSDKTIRLHSILRKRLKKIYLGEHGDF